MEKNNYNLGNVKDGLRKTGYALLCGAALTLFTSCSSKFPEKVGTGIHYTQQGGDSNFVTYRQAQQDWGSDILLNNDRMMRALRVHQNPSFSNSMIYAGTGDGSGNDLEKTSGSIRNKANRAEDIDMAATILRNAVAATATYLTIDRLLDGGDSGSSSDGTKGTSESGSITDVFAPTKNAVNGGVDTGYIDFSKFPK